MVWLFLILFVAFLFSAIIFLINRFCKFSYNEKKPLKNKKRTIIISTVTVFIIIIILCLLIGFINAIIFLLYLAGFWIICDIVFYVISLILKRGYKRYYAGGLAIILTIVYLSFGWYMAYNVWETKYNIETDKKIGNIRIVQFADSHIGTTFDGEEFMKYVNEMQNANPDAVVITGDFVDDATSREDMEDACRALGMLNTTYGVYFSFGNHDEGYYGAERRGFNKDDLIDELEKNNVVVLEDESVLIDNRFYIIGRKDLSEERNGNPRLEMSELIKNLDKTKYMIVLDHQPRDFEKEAAAGVDLVFSGHTHGGQMIPINYAVKHLGGNDSIYGLEKRNNTSFIVTSGISDWEVKFKTGCKSEYVVADIKSVK